MNLMRKNRLPILIVPLLALISHQTACAYYDPGAQRWLNRDPVLDKGFRVATRVKAPAEGPNSFLFLRNGPVNALDAFGLFSVPPGSSDGAGGQYWESIGHCIAIGQARHKEYERLNREHQLGSDADKWYHCVTSCEMTRTCGAGTTWLLGNVVWEFVYPSHDADEDRAANRDGRNCGSNCKEKRSCEECCEALGYRRF
jgi:hypothetical protein